MTGPLTTHPVPESTVGEAPALRIQILGPLRVWRGDDDITPTPRRQAQLLAALVARHGQAVSVDELIKTLWDERPPRTALNVIHKYVGALRRILEPGLGNRAEGSLLLRRGNGYLCDVGPGVDLVRFRELVALAAAAARDGADDRAFEHYLTALELWRGPVGDGIEGGTTFAVIDDEFLTACIAATELAVSLGRAEQVLPHLQVASSIAPLHEQVQASLVTSLGSAGRRAEALAVFAAVRQRLADDLGIDPGSALVAAQRFVLSAGDALSPDPQGQRTDFVGRRRELSAIRTATESLFRGGSAVVLIEGDPGSGKSHLVARAADELRGRGALVLSAICADGDGTPSMWPWMQLVQQLMDQLPEDSRARLLTSGLDRLAARDWQPSTAALERDRNARFRLFEGLSDAVAEVSARHPLVLVIDDLHWADAESLEVVSHLASRMPRSAALIGALRSRAPAPSSELTHMLAAVGRQGSHVRIPLHGLARDDIEELVHDLGSADETYRLADEIHARTAGNAFFVTEIVRGLRWSPTSELDAVAGALPLSVRDVIADRVSDLSERARLALCTAALMGKGFDVSLLANAIGVETTECIDLLSDLESRLLVEPGASNPFEYRFCHDLVRQAVLDGMVQGDTRALHLGIANALADRDEGFAAATEQLAHHLWSAGPLADRERTLTALISAGRFAASKTAFSASERLFSNAALMARDSGAETAELDALRGLITIAGMRSLYDTGALEHLERAEELARAQGLGVEAASFLYVRWIAHGQLIGTGRSRPLAEHLKSIAEQSHDDHVRALGLQAWGIQRYSDGDVAEAYENLLEANRIGPGYDSVRDSDSVGHDQFLLRVGLLAEASALQNHPEQARVIIRQLEPATLPYDVTSWATHGARLEAMIGDPVRALVATRRGLAIDPDFDFVFLGTYLRLVHRWASALTGADPADDALAAEKLIDSNLMDPPRPGVALFLGYLSEAWLAAGERRRAWEALERGVDALSFGQGYPEGLLLLDRARLLHASGAAYREIAEVIEECRVRSAAHGTPVFGSRAQTFLATLD